METKNKKSYKSYLAGPIGVIPQKGAAEWRIEIGKKLAEMGIKTSNPMGNEAKLDRNKLQEWVNTGKVNKIRKTVRTKLIGVDLRMVVNCDFLTLYIPVDNGYEICGSYGEVTLAYYLHKPVYIVTDRKLLPLQIPCWATGCSTWIFRTWEEYLKYIKEHYGK